MNQLNKLINFSSLDFNFEKVGIPSNIEFISVTLLVLKDDKFNSFNEEQL